MKKSTRPTKRVIPCLCGKRVHCDDVSQTLTHDPPECDSFKEIVERNRGNPYVDVPQKVTAAVEDAEVAIITSKVDPSEIIAVAESFGLSASDISTAARNVLREMRARGWEFSFPS